MIIENITDLTAVTDCARCCSDTVYIDNGAGISGSYPGEYSGANGGLKSIRVGIYVETVGNIFYVPEYSSYPNGSCKDQYIRFRRYELTDRYTHGSYIRVDKTIREVSTDSGIDYGKLTETTTRESTGSSPANPGNYINSTDTHERNGNTFIYTSIDYYTLSQTVRTVSYVFSDEITDTLAVMSTHADVMLSLARSDPNLTRTKSYSNLTRSPQPTNASLGAGAFNKIISKISACPELPEAQRFSAIFRSYLECQPSISASYPRPYAKMIFQILRFNYEYFTWAISDAKRKWYLIAYDKWVYIGYLGPAPTYVAPPGPEPSPAPILGPPVITEFNLDLSNPGGPTYKGPVTYYQPQANYSNEATILTNTQFYGYKSTSAGATPTANIFWPLKPQRT